MDVLECLAGTDPVLDRDGGLTHGDGRPVLVHATSRVVAVQVEFFIEAERLAREGDSVLPRHRLDHWR